MRKLLVLVLIILVFYGLSATFNQANPHSQPADDLSGFLRGVTQMFVDGIAGMVRTAHTRQEGAPRATPKLLTERDVKGLTGGSSVAAKCQISIAEIENEILARINAERNNLSLPALVKDSALSSGARSRSEDQVKRNYNGHYDPVTGATLMHDFGAKGEIATGARATCLASDSAQDALTRWMNSPTHRDVILSLYMTRAGAGVAMKSPGVMIATVLFSY